MESQCQKTPPDRNLTDFNDISDFEDYDNEDRDPEYVPESVSDSESDLSDTFVPVGLVTYNPTNVLPIEEASLQPSSLSPVIPFPDFQDETLDINEPNESSHQKTSPTQAKTRKLDKKHFCLFCGKGVTKLKRHLLSFHENEPEMFSFNAASGKSKECELKKLRHAGDHLHNIAILKKGDGEIVVKRNLKRKTTNDDFVPCPRCLGYFLKRDLWRHRCLNVSLAENIPLKKLVKQGRLMLPNTEKDGLGDVFESLRKDNISIIIKNDETIKMIGQREFQRNGHDSDRHAHIRNKMRELGRLLLKLREVSHKPSAPLKEFISPGHFQDVLDATKKIAGYSLQTKTYNIPGLALKLGHSLQRCSVLLKAKAIESKDLQTKADCDAFEELISIKWNEEISSQASRTMYQNKKNCANAIPLSEDIGALSKYLQDQSTSLRIALQEESQKTEIKQHWLRLAEVTLTIIILFNRRRQGEASKMTVSDYKRGIGSQNHSDDVLAGLTKFEQALCKNLKRIEITGKRGRHVPVILTDDMKAAMDALLETREEAGISTDNCYFFARANNLSLGHLRGSDCLRKITEEAPLQLKQPQLLRSTRLRKHIAMLTQLVNLKDHELDVIAQYMGHDIRIHREHYRLPSGTVQVAKVAKLLMSLNEGKLPTESELNDDTIEYDVADGSSDDDEFPQSDTNSVTVAPSKDKRSSRKTNPIPSTSSSSISGCHTTATRDMSGRRRWTAEEEEACMRGFRRQMAVGHLPGKADIMRVMQQEPVLEDRTWVQVKNFIRNHLKKSR